MKHFKTKAIIGTSLLLWAGVASANPSSWGSGGATGTHAVTASPTAPNGTTGWHGHLVGSDTLNELMDQLLLDMIGHVPAQLSGSTTSGNEGYTVYEGLGSSVGQRWAEGSPDTVAGDPQCLTNDGNGAPEANPGCEEITPMSRQLSSAICDDDLDDGSATFTNSGLAGAPGSQGPGPSNHNYQAEGLAVCMDGVVVITDNHSIGEYGDDSTACSTWNFGAGAVSDNSGNVFTDHGVGNVVKTGTLPSSGYQIGVGDLASGNAWKDALRLIYTGCTNNVSGTFTGKCVTANPTTRTTRCNSAARVELLADWHKVFPGTDCGSAGNSCSLGIRQVYRRDDGSGTSGSFLELLGVDKDPPNLVSRSTITSDGTTLTAIPDKVAFCDGGQNEGFIPTALDGTSSGQTFALGDPIRKDCAVEDDLCAWDGKAPVVRSVRSAPDLGVGVNDYPQYQCSAGLFSRKTYIFGAGVKVCPDNTKPNAAGCKFPYYDTPGTHIKNFDCLNPQHSRPSTVPGTIDGRTYNFVMHQSNGVVRFSSGGPSQTDSMPQVASWRQNMAELNTSGDPGPDAGFLFAPGSFGDKVCQESDATKNIGCIVAHTTCTLGFSGREAAYSTLTGDYLQQEPLQIKDSGPSDTDVLTGTYPFARKLWLNAIHGFENISFECAARGGTANECADELAIANQFRNYDGNPLSTTNHIAPLCKEMGFIPMPSSGTGAGPQCVGAQNSGAAVTCGAPDVQAITACDPH